EGPPGSGLGRSWDRRGPGRILPDHGRVHEGWLPELGDQVSPRRIVGAGPLSDPMITLGVPQGTRRSVKGWLKRLRLAGVRRLYGFDGHDLARLLRQLGVGPGVVLLVHSSWDRFQGFPRKPS